MRFLLIVLLFLGDLFSFFFLWLVVVDPKMIVEGHKGPLPMGERFVVIATACATCAAFLFVTILVLRKPSKPPSGFPLENHPPSEEPKDRAARDGSQD